MKYGLTDFKMLKREYGDLGLKDFEWLFIALLKDGVRLAVDERPEAALTKCVDRQYMKEDVGTVLKTLPERKLMIVKGVLIDDMTCAQLSEKAGVTPGRVQQLFDRAILTIRLNQYHQRVLIGESRQRIEAWTGAYEPAGDESIDCLGLSVRAYNPLKRAGIDDYQKFRERFKEWGCLDADVLKCALAIVIFLGPKHAKEILARMEESCWLNFLKK